MKRIIVLALSALVVAALAGCGGQSASSGSASSGSASSASASATASSASAAASAAAASSAASSENYVEGVRDSADLYEAFLVDSADQYEEYLIVYYGDNTGIMKAFANERHYAKESDVTLEELEGYDIEDDYPNFNSLSFASKQVFEDGDDLIIYCLFDELDEKANLLACHNNGILTLADTSTDYVDAYSFMDSIEQNGGERVDPADYEKENLHF